MPIRSWLRMIERDWLRPLAKRLRRLGRRGQAASRIEALEQRVEELEGLVRELTGLAWNPPARPPERLRGRPHDLAAHGPHRSAGSPVQW